MPADALTQFAPSSTKIAAFRHTATAQSFPGGTPRRGGVCRVVYSAASTSSGAGTAAFSMDISYDGGSTWMSEFFSDTIVLSTTPASGEIFIPYRVVANVMKAGGATAPLVAFALNSITGTGATITYVADNVPGGPA